MKTPAFLFVLALMFAEWVWMKARRAKSAAFFLLCVLCASAVFPGCSTTTGNAATDRRHAVENQLGIEAARILGRVAFATLTDVATEELSGGKADWGHSASQAVWQNAGSIVDSTSIERVINAGSARQLPAVADTAGHQFAIAVSRGVPPRAAANAVADTISAASIRQSQADNDIGE